MVRSGDTHYVGVSWGNVCLRSSTSIQLIVGRASFAEIEVLLRVLQPALPELHHGLPEIILSVEVGIAYADKSARQMSLDRLATLYSRLTCDTHCVAEVDERVAADDSD